MLGPPAHGAPAASRLDEVRARIEALQRKLTESEGVKAEAVDALRESEQAISETNRKVFLLAGRQRELRASLGRLEVRRHQTEESVASQREALGKVLYQQYLAGQAEPLKLLLSGRDPNAVARGLHYLTYVSRARSQLISGLRRELDGLDAITRETEGNSRELAELAAEQAKQKRELEGQRHAREGVLRRVSQQINQQRHQMEVLKHNEERLTRLVERLARQIARVPTPRSHLRNEHVPEAGTDAGSFRQLRGRLKLPVVGELVNRFGSPREDSGLSWKGLFISAHQGDEVRAVASGRVVFADWLRGFGNLLIIDHGGGYLSLYGNNDSLYKRAGDPVRAAEAVAAVGATGGNPDSGLYFELRYQGKPFDPLSWATLK